MDTAKTQFRSVSNAAVVLGLPKKWLAVECRAGRLPCIRAGRRLLVDPEQIRQALAARAEQAVQHGE